MNSNLVSIVMPVYNVESYIEKALESALHQTYKNIEILVINDGTKDNSIKKIEKQVNSDSRIIVINRENGGLSAARNTGLESAKGEYLMFFDSDDTISENLVEAALRRAKDTAADVVVFGFENLRCDRDEVISPAGTCEFQDSSISETIEASEAPEFFLGGIGYAWNKLYRTEFLKKNGISFEQGLSLIEDVVFNREVFSKTSQIAFLSGAYYQYYARERTTLSNQFYDDFISMFQRSFDCRAEIMQRFYPKAKNADALLANNYVNGVRFYYAMILKFGKNRGKKNMSQMRAVLREDLTQEQVENYRPVGVKDQIVKWCLKFRQAELLYFLYQMRGTRI